MFNSLNFRPSNKVGHLIAFFEALTKLLLPSPPNSSPTHASSAESSDPSSSPPPSSDPSSFPTSSRPNSSPIHSSHSSSYPPSETSTDPQVSRPSTRSSPSQSRQYMRLVENGLNLTFEQFQQFIESDRFNCTILAFSHATTFGSDRSYGPYDLWVCDHFTRSPDEIESPGRHSSLYRTIILEDRQAREDRQQAETVNQPTREDNSISSDSGGGVPLLTSSPSENFSSSGSDGGAPLPQSSPPERQDNSLFQLERLGWRCSLATSQSNGETRQFQLK
jgi:hypothetical protein